MNYTGEERPWGNFLNLYEEDGFKVKRIEVKPGEMLSLQLHHHRSEHWICVRGEGIVVVGDREIVLRENEHVFIPKKTKHRAENRNSVPFVFVEVQVGDYLGEDDIVRFEDKYGRIE